MAKGKEMSFNPQRLLTQLDIHPILVDVGASGDAPAIWDTIAASAIYVGFDPDLRDLREISDGHFFRSTIVNAAVVDSAQSNEISFYLTQSPYCSSSLLPNKSSLEDYLFSDLFTVERSVTVKSTTLDSVLSRLSLPLIDWLKIDSQGTDLRIFTSLNGDTQAKVLALDVEPGLIDAYIGEDLFVDVHRDLTKRGFWLSDLNIQHIARMRRSTVQQAQVHDKRLKDRLLQRSIPQSPGWCEARYLRTLSSMAENKLAAREYVLLWLFAIVDGQIGFALDVAVEYARIFGDDDVSRLLRDETINRVKKAMWSQRVFETVRLLLRPVIKPFRRP